MDFADIQFSHHYKPWAIYQLLPDLQRICKGRFQSKAEAYSYYYFLKRRMPTVPLALVFEAQTAIQEKR